jgi:hypothetical protein
LTRSSRRSKRPSPCCPSPYCAGQRRCPPFQAGASRQRRAGYPPRDRRSSAPLPRRAEARGSTAGRQGLEAP